MNYRSTEDWRHKGVKVALVALVTVLLVLLYQEAPEETDDVRDLLPFIIKQKTFDYYLPERGGQRAGQILEVVPGDSILQWVDAADYRSFCWSLTIK